jgi:hypothetical protein
VLHSLRGRLSRGRYGCGVARLHPVESRLRRYLKNFTLTKVAKRMEQVDASIARGVFTQSGTKAEFQLTILDDGIGPRHGDSTISKNDNKPLLTYNQITSTL